MAISYYTTASNCRCYLCEEPGSGRILQVESGHELKITDTTLYNNYYYYAESISTGVQGYVGNWEVDALVPLYVPNKCTAPTSVTVSDNTPEPSTNVTLSWSGAKAGTDHTAKNTIVGYDIYRNLSINGTYIFLKSVTSTATSGSTTVTSPSSAGVRYYYRVVTRGSAGSSYYSVNSTSYAVVTSTETYTASPALPPGIIKLSSEETYANGIVRLEWDETVLNDATLTGYELYRATSSGGSYSLLTTFSTTNIKGSTFVYAPATGSYFYKIKAVASDTSLSSELSEEVTLKSRTTHETISAKTNVGGY